MKSTSAGFILLTTLFIVSLIALLVIANMKSVSLYFKTNNQVVISHEAFYQLEVVANKIGLSNKDKCLSSVQNPNQLVQALGLSQGCDWVMFNQSYHYLVSDLGLYPCLQIGISSSHHWLVSVMNTASPSHVLQLRWAVPGEKANCLEDKSHQIASGVISWRYM